MNSKVVARLEALERLRMADSGPVLNLIFECNDVNELPAMLDYCDKYNEPPYGIHHSVKWIGEPNADAAAILAGKGGTI